MRLAGDSGGAFVGRSSMSTREEGVAGAADILLALNNEDSFLPKRPDLKRLRWPGLL